MGYSEQDSNSNRRNVLKGISTGAFALPILTGTTTATQSSCSLNVRVEAGEGDSENWTSRDYITDDFRGRIQVSGLSSSSSYIATMMVPMGPPERFNGDLVRTEVEEVAQSSAEIIDLDVWNPGGIGPFGTWPSGRYYLYAVVAEARQGNFGAAISDPFEINV